LISLVAKDTDQALQAVSINHALVLSVWMPRGQCRLPFFRLTKRIDIVINTWVGVNLDLQI